MYNPAIPGKPATVSLGTIARGELINKLEKDHQAADADKVAPAWGAFTKNRAYPNNDLNLKYHAEDTVCYLYERSASKHLKAGDRYPPGSLISVYGKYSKTDPVGWKPPCGGYGGNNGEIDPSCTNVVTGLLGSSAANARKARKDKVEEKSENKVGKKVGH